MLFLQTTTSQIQSMYTSKASKGIKICRAILYASLVVCSIVLIAALTHTDPRGSEWIKLKHPETITYPYPPYPQPYPNVTTVIRTISAAAAAVETAAVEKRHAVRALVESSAVASSSTGPCPTSSPSYPYPYPYPYPHPPWGGSRTRYYEVCYLYDYNVVQFIAISGLVTALCIMVVTFVLPTLDGTFLDFLSYFGLEVVFAVLLLALWSVVAGFTTQQAVQLLQCSKRSKIAPLILTFAWLGFLSALLLAAGFFSIAVIENARGNKKIWTSRVQDYVFGEQAIRLPTVTSDDLASPVVRSG